MGARYCGARCHRAICKTCRCWCGGVFHGVTSGADARRAFFDAYHDWPKTREQFDALTMQQPLFDVETDPGATLRAQVAAAVTTQTTRTLTRAPRTPRERACRCCGAATRGRDERGAICFDCAAVVAERTSAHE